MCTSGAGNYRLKTREVELKTAGTICIPDVSEEDDNPSFQPFFSVT